MTLLKNLARYVLLPRTQTEFEKAHIAKMNRVSTLFFITNLPVFAAIAHFNGTGFRSAVLLTTLVIAGPAIATLLMPTARLTSIIQGVASMCMGGLLVHFGQGPLQIEMHFYFFMVLAMLSVFGNPMVIASAAVTVTLHHLLVWEFAPQSIFNYEASIIVVAVHAAFVVTESVAAVFLARSYFDNVIGLERIIQQRTAQLDVANQSMRRIMMHVSQGLMTVDREGHVVGERSARVHDWLGEVPASASMVDYLAGVDDQAALWFEIGWQDLIDGFMPLEVTLAQMPATVTLDDAVLHVDYLPIGGGETGEFDQMLVVLTDVTAERAQAEAEAARRQMLKVLENYAADPNGFGLFVHDANDLVHQLTTQQYGSVAVCRRWIHTLKGNSLTFGLDAFGKWLHELEDVLLEEDRGPNEGELAALDQAWTNVQQSLSILSHGEQDGRLHVHPSRAEEITRAVRDRRSPDEILSILHTLDHEPAEERLQSVARQVERIADRLGRHNVRVEVDADGVFLPPVEWAPFWSSISHVLRNAIDHGLEESDEREEAGKSPIGHLVLGAERAGNYVDITITDDGRGIDWDKIAAKAESLGLPFESEADLHEALFTDGLSTRDEATEMSGRGVGMSAVRAAVDELGGVIEVQSMPGRGTTWIFRMPCNAATAAA